ncbi:carbohydrate ABC transporter permease [Propioniferax innocua]|uniref:Carbohydrate ABC transporter membrane protein 2 (CUT1 family) n=1 Tax=Propioniferax innocua TaxID=1753 RepID=A0A542ZPQ6_9ACTN|nr:carbohydrate ABC transporter permease [Propioniferax innocua]TQL62345.1 carbohydrate ABC transporter membrane protein 2 (CUT1 family) [Propioniferax innocua]
MNRISDPVSSGDHEASSSEASSEQVARPAASLGDRLMVVSAWGMALVWVFPLLLVLVMALRDSPTDFSPWGGWTFENLTRVWNAAPFGIFLRNSFLLVVGLTSTQVVLGVLAAYAFARFEFRGRDVLFFVVLAQLVIYPEIMLSENFFMISRLGLDDTLLGVGLPYAASAFAIFLLRQAFKTVPGELVEAAVMEGMGRLRVLWHVYLPLCRSTVAAFAMVSVSFHWNNFLWPLIATRTNDARPVTVGVVRFMAPESGIDYASLTAGTFIIVTPLLVFFIIMQRQFVQSFMRSGIK